MSIKILLVFSICYLSFFSPTNSQIVEIARSKTIETTKKNLIRAGIASGPNGYYIIEMIDVKINRIFESAQGKYRLIRFNNELDLVESKDTEIKLKSYKAKVEYFTIFEDELLVFSSSLDSDSNKKYIYLHKFDAESLEETEEPIKIYESDYIGFFKDASVFGFSLSPNKSKILIYELNVLKKQKRELGICVLNQKTEKLWEKKFLLEGFKRQDTMIRRAAIDDSGNVFFLKKTFFNLELHFDHPFQHNGAVYALISIDAMSQKKEKVFVEHDKKSITDMDMGLLENGTPFMMGYFSDEKATYTSGVIQINCLPEGESFKLKNSFAPFSDKILALNQKRKPKAGKKKKMKRFMVKKVFQKPNSNLTIIGERLYLDSYSNGSSSVKRVVHESILISNHQLENGEILSANKIAKHGDLKFERFVNFYTHRKGNDVFFIYNDHPGNMNYPGYGKIKKAADQIFRKKSQISIGHFSEDGTMKTAPLFPGSSEKLQKFYPRSSLQISEDEMLIIERTERQFEIVKLKIEN